MRNTVMNGMALTAVALCCRLTANAVINDWTNGAGGAWEDTNNWSLAILPDVTTTARVNASGTYTVTIGSSAANTAPESFTNAFLIVDPASGHASLDFTYTNALPFVLTNTGVFAVGLDIENGTINWNAPNGTLAVSSILHMNNNPGSGTGVVNVLAGTVEARNRFQIANTPGAVSVINVYTNGILASKSSDTRFGSSGLGQINILGGTMIWSNQAFVGYTVGSTGRVVLSEGLLRLEATGKMDIGAGFTQSSSDGFGQVIISNGLFFSEGAIYVGSGPRGKGELQLIGGSVTNTTRPMFVGNGSTDSLFFPSGSATGSVLIAGGNWFDNNGWAIGDGSNSLGVVTISNGTVNIAGSPGDERGFIHIGTTKFSRGELNLAGGTVSISSNLIVGLASGSTGTVVITAGNLGVTNAAGAARIVVGQGGRGTFTLNGGTVTTDKLFVTNGANSVFTFNGGTLSTKGTTVSNTAAFVVGNGTAAATLNLQGGTHTFADGLTVSANATLDGDGFSAAYVTGPLTLASNSTLVVELMTNSVVPLTGYDRIFVDGNVSLLDATLTLDLTNFTAVAGAEFILIDNDLSDAVNGMFAGLPQGTEFSSEGVGFKINYAGNTGNDVVLTVIVPEPATIALVILGGIVLRARLRPTTTSGNRRT